MATISNKVEFDGALYNLDATK